MIYEGVIVSKGLWFWSLGLSATFFAQGYKTETLSPFVRRACMSGCATGLFLCLLSVRIVTVALVVHAPRWL